MANIKFTTLPDDVREWLESRPASIQKAFVDFPPGRAYMVNGLLAYVIGWKEPAPGDLDDDVMIIFSRLDPDLDYDAAVADPQRLYVCAKHLR